MVLDAARKATKSLMSKRARGIVLKSLGLTMLLFLGLWFAGFGVVIFFLINGYLLGQEYFRFAALRFNNEADARKLGSRFSLETFLCGLIIAAVMSIPVINLVTPVFAAVMMVHLHKAISYRQQE